MKNSSPQSAFSLVEVTLALGIAVFCLTALLGLLPVGLGSTKTAIEQTTANEILSAVVADLRAAPPTMSNGEPTISERFGLSIPVNPVATAPDTSTLFFAPGGAYATTIQPDSRYRVEVEFPANGSGNRTATYASLKVSWPAQVESDKAVGKARLFTSLDRN